MNPEKIIESAVTAFVGAMAGEVTHDDYNQEIHDTDHGDHTHENVPTHVAHALGRMVGYIAKATVNPHGLS